MTTQLLDTANKKLLSITKRPNVIMEKGRGMYLWDTDGKKYLDFIGGWAVCSLGHSPKIISKALSSQSKKLINSSPSFYNKPMLEYTKLLIDNSSFDRVWFGNSGAEVNEAAVKLVRKFGSLYKNDAYEIITANNSFHGRTLAMMNATGKTHWETLFNPKPEGFIHVPFNDIDSIKNAINEKTVAIMIEPIQGEGGVNPATTNYIKQLRNICDENNILLVFDEVQTGFGRVGKVFAYQHFGIEPDVITLAKGIGGGFPLSAIMVKEKLDIFEPGEHGGTYGGQQLAMSVGKAVLNELLNSKILNNVTESGLYLKRKLSEISEEFNFSNIRGEGLLIGLNLYNDNGLEITNKCLSNGLIINSPKPNMLRFMPPLIVSKVDIDKMVEKLVKSIRELS